MELELKELIKNDFNASMKSGDNITRDTLRLLNSDIKNKEIELRKKLNEDEIISVIKNSAKKRKDSIEQFTKGGRADLVSKEKEELAVLEKYMPEQMSKKEVSALVEETIKELGASNVSDFGKVMKEVMQKANGAADGKMVSGIVKKELGKIGE